MWLYELVGFSCGSLVCGCLVSCPPCLTASIVCLFLLLLLLWIQLQIKDEFGDHELSYFELNLEVTTKICMCARTCVICWVPCCHVSHTHSSSFSSCLFACLVGCLVVVACLFGAVAWCCCYRVTTLCSDLAPVVAGAGDCRHCFSRHGHSICGNSLDAFGHKATRVVWCGVGCFYDERERESSH